jgi:ferrous iron transport protein B
LGQTADGIIGVGRWLADIVSALAPGPFRQSAVDGVIKAGGVIVFLPQILILFAFLAILETAATWPGRRI